jgi:tetratricopeptide (TPR) repeat protein
LSISFDFLRDIRFVHMTRIYLRCLFTVLVLFYLSSVAIAQDIVWQITAFDINANIQQAERTLAGTAVLTATNVGRGTGNTFTFRINNKAAIKSVTAGGANANFRVVPETTGNIQRVTTTLPTAVGSNGNITLSISYTLPVESNTGLAAISPIGSQFLPLSFWYPAPNSPFTARGADTARFQLTVNGGNVISAGIEKGSGIYDQPFHAQPFFVQGEWDRIDGAADARGISALVPKGIAADERKQAEALIALAAAARSYFVSLLGPAPEVPIRLVAVRRGAGFHDAGTILVERSAFRRTKTDSATALLIGEALAQLWIGNQTPIRGEGGGFIRDGLTRYLATQFIEKQFGRDAAESELLRQRLNYLVVVRRDAPLARTTQLDDAYFSSVPNKGAMVWRLIDQRLGRETFAATLKSLLQADQNSSGLTLAATRAALAEKGNEKFKATLDAMLDQVTDTDLMIGLPQQRGAEWVSALRNLGSSEATVRIVGTTDRGEQLSVDATVPARGFGEAVFKSSSRIVRAEVDPDKLYPQLDYSNDVAPRVRNIKESLDEVTRLINSQDNVRAETVSRELLSMTPQMQEARIFLARSLLAQNKLDEAEKLFKGVLDDPLPTSLSMAWANIGLGQIASRKGQAAEAAKRFNDAARAEADYGTAVIARAERIKAEATPAIDESARAFISQLDAAIVSGKKADLESRIVSGELVRFVGGIVGTQPEAWQTRVLRTEQFDANTLVADVAIQAKELGKDQAGPAVLVLSKAGGAWKLGAIELFEVR